GGPVRQEPGGSFPEISPVLHLLRGRLAPTIPLSPTAQRGTGPGPPRRGVGRSREAPRNLNPAITRGRSCASGPWMAATPPESAPRTLPVRGRRPTLSANRSAADGGSPRRVLGP